MDEQRRVQPQSIPQPTHEISSRHVSLDIDRLAKSVVGKLRILRPFSDKFSIYRVPKQLRELNEKAYTPQVISIGPLHHGEEELEGMEEHKTHYLMEFLELSRASVKNFIEIIAEKETSLRNCYAETFGDPSREEFVEMMLLDCSFVIMFLLKCCFPSFAATRNDRIFNKPWMSRQIWYDLCLLENQLPLFILEDLLKLSGIVLPLQEHSMSNLTYKFLRTAWRSWVPENINLEQTNFSQVHHFVDCLRICQQPAQQRQPKNLAILRTPSVAELHRAGIKFKLGSNANLFDIKFDEEKGTLEIPQLQISDQTEVLFRNLQAFEQCNYLVFSICDYITMLSLLVANAKDVEILEKEGIIENWLNDNDAVSSLFRNLSKGNAVDAYNFYFSGVVEDLNKYCSKRRHKWRAALKQNYFQNPWTIISVIAAVVLLILTVIQTVCSILQVI